MPSGSRSQRYEQLAVSTRKLAMVCGCSSRAVAVLVSHCPVCMRRKQPLQPHIAHEIVEIPWHPCRPSATILWDVWHTPWGGGCRIFESLRAGGWRMKLQTELTWLANCMRRILAKLMMAVAVEWRERRWCTRPLAVFDVASQ